MPRNNSTNWSVGDTISATRLQDFNQDIDDIYSFWSDRWRLTQSTLWALQVYVWAFSYIVWTIVWISAATDWIAVTNNAINYIEINNVWTIIVNTTGWTPTNARIWKVTTSGWIITAIEIWKSEIIWWNLWWWVPQTVFPVDEWSSQSVFSDNNNFHCYIRSDTSDLRLTYTWFSTDRLVYNAGVIQQVARTTIWATATWYRYAIIVDWYIYAMLTDWSATRIYRCAITSNIASAGSWTQLTISWTALWTNHRLIWYWNGAFWTATWTTFQPYTLSWTTLTSWTAVNVTWSSYSVNSRVNSTWIYAYFTTAPNHRRANFSWTLDWIQFNASGFRLFATTNNVFIEFKDIVTNPQSYILLPNL